MTTPVLDWVPRHDERSRSYAVRSLMPTAVRRKRTNWNVPGVVIDQGREGACVGFGWTNDLRSRPNPMKFPDPTQFALGLYHLAQKLDDQPGENYSGTSVLAGAKAASKLGYLAGYHWAFGIDDVIDALVTRGPVVLGIPWYDSMYDTRPSGLIDVGGQLAGGHCILATGYDPAKKFTDGTFEVVRLYNSWGPSYGIKGYGWVKVTDLANLLADQGEACVPEGKTIK